MASMKVGIVNFGMGNLASISNALNRLEVNHIFLEDAGHFNKVGKLILPGVGAFGSAMEALRERGMVDALLRYVEDLDRHVLGICLGMQLLLSESCEHGDFHGLNLLPGRVKFLKDVMGDLLIPNIGWCNVKARGGSVLLSNLSKEQLCFYFVHSYYCVVDDRKAVSGLLDYGDEIDVVVEHENIFGCQFHPEKSQRSGLQVLENFIRL